MLYFSTRDRHKREKTFSEIVLEGLAPDRGLYIPKYIPKIESATLWSNGKKRIIGSWPPNCCACMRQSSKMKRAAVLANWQSSAILHFARGKLWHCGAWGAWGTKGAARYILANYSTAQATPLRTSRSSYWARFWNACLRKQKRKLALLGATSGDTGAAAIYGVRGMRRIQLAVLHPHNRISEVQRKQMCSVLDANICNIAIKGDFDDCQSIVKALLEQSKRDPNMPALGAVNSINWGRILSQMSYYFALYFRLAEEH